ncbi:MAG: cytidine deaminase [Candidatus Neomarinimicrobiota bacterium]|nr:MAG: cytidine deaminase [Candidatus Neomarinimicrobiota bacterium]
MLKERAIEASKFSHSPYSKYSVGAAVETEDGEIFVGCNVESSSYGLSVCAERNAIAAAIVNGHKQFRAMAVYSRNGATPCGACRQVIWDICGDIPVYVYDEAGKEKTYRTSELLPNPFDCRKFEE